MGKIRIKKIGLDKAEDKKPEKGEEKKKTAKVPGLKGGERIKEVAGVIIEEEIPQEKPAQEKVEEKKVKEVKPSKVRGKKYQKAAQLLDKTKLYPLDEALELVKKTSIANFDGSVEVHVNLPPKFKGSKYSLVFPHPTGQKTIILAFGKGGKKAGADIEGDEKMIKKIREGFKDFTLVLATPEWMPKLAPIAKFLGPRGLMPNPKTGTVTDDLNEAIKKLKSSKTILIAEKKAPLIHTVIGQIPWPIRKLKENLKALIKAVDKTKIKRLTICASMGPGIKVNPDQT